VNLNFITLQTHTWWFYDVKITIYYLLQLPLLLYTKPHRNYLIVYLLRPIFLFLSYFLLSFLISDSHAPPFNGSCVFEENCLFRYKLLPTPTFMHSIHSGSDKFMSIWWSNVVIFLTISLFHRNVRIIY
jgi:hypothetical protein